MSKLFKLKEWLTIPDTAKYLSVTFGEEVSEADVLHLALDGHLKLSVNFVNHTYAKCGKIVSWDETAWYCTEPIVQTNYPIFYSLGVCEEKMRPSAHPKSLKNLFKMFPIDGKYKMHYFMKSKCIDDKRFLNLEEEINSIEGIWDLSMADGERLDIERKYQQLTDGVTVTLKAKHGCFLEKPDGQACMLQESKKKINVDKFYPADGLPEDSFLVVRTAALRELEDSMKETTEKPLSTTERHTLLTIITALCDYSDIPYQERGAATQIARLTDGIGASVSDDAIRRALDKIPDALEARSK